MAAYNEVPVYCEIKRLARLSKLARDCDTAAQYGELIDADDGFSGSSRFASLMAFRA